MFCMAVRQAVIIFLRNINTVFTQMQDEVFSLKFDASICEVVLNSLMTR